MPRQHQRRRRRSGTILSTLRSPQSSPRAHGQVRNLRSSSDGEECRQLQSWKEEDVEEACRRGSGRQRRRSGGEGEGGRAAEAGEEEAQDSTVFEEGNQAGRGISSSFDIFEEEVNSTGRNSFGRVGSQHSTFRFLPPHSSSRQGTSSRSIDEYHERSTTSQEGRRRHPSSSPKTRLVVHRRDFEFYDDGYDEENEESRTSWELDAEGCWDEEESE